MPPAKIFRILPVLIVIALAAVALAQGATLGVLAFALAGLACSACLPLSIGAASSETPRFVETVSGWMVASCMVGYGIGAFAVGPLREVADLRLSEVYFWAIVIAWVLIVLALGLPAARRVFERRPKSCRLRRRRATWSWIRDDPWGSQILEGWLLMIADTTPCWKEPHDGDR